jgi:hypothetical protein
MFIQFHRRDRIEAGSALSAVLHWRKGALLTLLLAILALLQLASAPAAWAFNFNLVYNAGFESGQLNKGWVKWGYPISVVGVDGSNRTPDGAWSGYIQPQGRYVELQQNITLIWGVEYHLQAYVKTNGMSANLGW